MYKFTYSDHTKVTNLETGSSDIHPGHWMWEEYQKWVDAGGITEPFDTRTDAEKLKASQTAMWEKIKAERDSRFNGGVLVGGNWFQSSLESKINYIGLKDELLESTGSDTDAIIIDEEPVMWETMNGEFVVITRKLIKDISKAIKVLEKRINKVAWIHRQNMMSSSSPETYDYSTDWPERFTQ